MTLTLAETKTATAVLDDDPLWYKDAIIYELHVRAFYDSDDDGIGDFRGLTQKLDYLKDLGVTAIWLLPFYPSPLKDDGYDTADYTNVHPSYGTLADFKRFMREATRRGIRVITELVVNHTSDQHPWFQRARRAPAGSRHRSFYVWNDTPDRYREARIIFKDFEASNWSWDPIAKAYFWHRFYSHQPDLNYESADVRRAVFRAMDHWLSMGVAGLRLDAVPYLYEREGTICENLPETHAFLKELRRRLDAKFKSRMLLAEANQWPEDAAAYFGDGDECHMNFHFPVMPRMFMALRMEDRFPIVDIMQQTPQIPENCQWAMFLRNHDELTLEMVTDEERDYMYRVYAHDRHARINLGIRRRLAPLLNNDRKKIELMNALLFSLPGTPVVYYGDEIGMGDNFYLGDRNGVRTPMQWSPDRNGGFSKANPQSLYLPVIIDPEYHYEAINVESQQSNPDSLLWWMKRIIALRKRYKAFGRGTLEFLHPRNPKVLAFFRKYQNEVILVVANLSRQAQHTHLDLRELEGAQITELFGGTQFPSVRSDPYVITLGPYAFYWFTLDIQRAPQMAGGTYEETVPMLSISGTKEEMFRSETRAALEGVLLSYIRRSRWFGGKARRIQSSTIADVIPVPYNSTTAHFVLVRIEYVEGEPETYVLPLSFASGSKAEEVMEQYPATVVARLRSTERVNGHDGIMFDALADQKFANALLHAIERHRQFPGERGEILTSRTSAMRRLRPPSGTVLKSRLVRAEQSNTSVIYEDRFILKQFRRLGDGINPDLEIGRFLTEKAQFPHTAPVAGALEYRRSRTAEPVTLGVLHGYVNNQGDAWRYTLNSLGQYFETVLTQHGVEECEIPGKPLLALSKEKVPELAEHTIGTYMAAAQLLGQRTGKMHLALASDPDDPNFAPEPFTDLYRRSLYQSMRNLSIQAYRGLRQQLSTLPEDSRSEAERVLSLESDVLGRFSSIRNRKFTGMRTRIHGDYHLGQVLSTGSDFVIIDFEGEPARPVSERRLKRSPLRDVSGMIRSFHYAANAALLGQAPTVVREEDLPALRVWAEFWNRWVSAAFLGTYIQTASKGNFLPTDQEELGELIDIYLLEKAVYELNYELNNRPAWVRVPLQGILRLMEGVG